MTTNNKRRDDWLSSCANRLISIHRYDYADADNAAERIAQDQEYRYGPDITRWLLGWGAADEWVETGEDEA